MYLPAVRQEIRRRHKRNQAIHHPGKSARVVNRLADLPPAAEPVMPLTGTVRLRRRAG